VAIAAVCLCTLAQAQSDLFQLGDKRNTNKYCGRNLANMLRYVCNGNYYPMFKKASQGNSTVNTMLLTLGDAVSIPVLQIPETSLLHISTQNTQLITLIIISAVGEFSVANPRVKVVITAFLNNIYMYIHVMQLILVECRVTLLESTVFGKPKDTWEN